MGRWISIDDISYIDTVNINRLNLYAYCHDNPISYIDSTGCFPILIALILGAGLIVGSIVGGKVAYDKAVSEGKTGSDLFWSTLGGVALGGAVGVAGAGLLMAGGAAIYAGAAYAITGAVGVTIAGMAATQIVAIGLLAYNIFAAVVAPIIGLAVELVDWINDKGKTKVPKPGEVSKHPYGKRLGRKTGLFMNTVKVDLLSDIGIRRF